MAGAFSNDAPATFIYLILIQAINKPLSIMHVPIVFKRNIYLFRHSR